MDPTQGDGTQKPQGQNPPAGFTPEQLEQISQVAAQVVNSGFTARTKKLREELTGEFGKLLEPLSVQLKDLAAPPAGGKGKGKGKDDDDGVADPKTAGMQRQLDDMKKQLDERDRRIAASEAKQRSTELRASLIRSLGENGLSETRRAELAAINLLAEGKVKHDEDGNAVYIENENSVLDLPTGIKAWAKSEDAKIFLPPTGARGSGDRPGQGAPKSGAGPQDVTATDLGLALVREYGGIAVGT